MTTFNHAALAAVHEALLKPRLDPTAQPADLVALFATVLQARGQRCYGAWMTADAQQLDEVCRALVQHLELTNYRKGE